MFLPMRLISRVLINTLILVQISFGLGTQFLSVPSNAIDLAFGSNPLLGKLALNNPALLSASPQGINMHMSYGSWLDNVSASSFALASKLNRGNIGLQLRHMGLNDLELRTTTPTDLPLATFGSSAFAIDGGYSRSFGGLKVGASLRYIFVQLHTEKITGYAVDAGIIRSIGKNIHMGISALNLGVMEQSATYSPSLPTRLLSAISYRFTRSPRGIILFVFLRKNPRLSMGQFLELPVKQDIISWTFVWDLISPIRLLFFQVVSEFGWEYWICIMVYKSDPSIWAYHK